MSDQDRPVDFLISYTSADQVAAEWVAWHLEDAGFLVVIQAWDFGPGSNFVAEMDSAARRAHRTVLIMTPAFFKSGFTAAEWAAAFARDPTGVGRRLVPIRMADFEVEGLLGQVVYIDLVGLPEAEAIAELIARVQPGRAKPSTPPPAPDLGPRRRTGGAQGESRLDWQPAPFAEVTWRDKILGGWAGPSVPMVEVQLVPSPDALVSFGDLRQLPNRLAAAGRDGGLFTQTETVDARLTDEVAFAIARNERSRDGQGMLITRRGQRGAWIKLPRDLLGAVLDPHEVTPRLSSTVGLLFGTDMPEPALRYIVAARIQPDSMVMLGTASAVGSRNSASLGTANLSLPVEDSINTVALLASPDAFASEIVARLEARLQR